MWAQLLRQDGWIGDRCFAALIHAEIGGGLMVYSFHRSNKRQMFGKIFLNRIV
ncbi:hypothetical protein LCGC14_1683990, partial [marine sediment metagenome]